MNLTNTEYVKLSQAKDESEWHSLISQIKSRRGGDYPPDWGQRILFGGFHNPSVNLGIETDSGNLSTLPLPDGALVNAVISNLNNQGLDFSESVDFVEETIVEFNSNIIQTTAYRKKIAAALVEEAKEKTPPYITKAVQNDQ